MVEVEEVESVSVEIKDLDYFYMICSLYCRNFMASTRQSLLSLQSTATTSSSTYTSTSGLIHGEYVHFLP